MTPRTAAFDGGHPVTAGCEKLWHFDHERLPVKGELDPLHAARWGEIYPDLSTPSLWPALYAWAEDGSHVTDTSDMPVAAEFYDRFQGVGGGAGTITPLATAKTQACGRDGQSSRSDTSTGANSARRPAKAMAWSGHQTTAPTVDKCMCSAITELSDDRVTGLFLH